MQNNSLKFQSLKNKSLLILSIAVFLLLVLNFNVAGAEGLVPCGTKVDDKGEITNPCGICNLFELISIIVNFITYKIAAPLATIMLIYGGVMLIISGGSEARKKQGLDAIWAAVWGLVIVFGAWLIVNTIINSLAISEFQGGWNKFPGC